MYLALVLGAACTQSKSAASGGTIESGAITGPGGESGQGGGISIITAMDAGSTFTGPPAGWDAKPWALRRCGQLPVPDIASLGKVAHYGNQSGGGDNTDAFPKLHEHPNQGNGHHGPVRKRVGSTRNFTLTADFLRSMTSSFSRPLRDSEYTAFGLSPVTRSVLCLTG